MNNNALVLVAVFAIMMAVNFGIEAKKRSTFRQLQSLLAARDFDALFKLLDAPLTTSLFPEYNLSYFRLNAYLVKDDEVETNKLLEELLNRKLNKRRRYDLVVKGFNIYVGQKNRQRAQELLDEIEGWQDEQLVPVQRESRLMFDIAILGKSDRIDEMERELGNTEGMERGRLEYLLALQYENRGDAAMRDDYLRRAAADSFPLPEEESVA